MAIIGVTRKRFWMAAAIGIFILLYTIQQASLEKLITSFEDIDWSWIILVLITCAMSYGCIAAVLYRLLKNIGHALSFSVALQISVLSCTLNYLMALGGLSGVAAKVYLLGKEKIPASNTLSVSIVHGFLTNTVAVVFIYLGFFYLYSEYKLSTSQVEGGILILIVAFALTWLTVQILINESFRQNLWRLCLKVASLLAAPLHRPQWFNTERMQAFFENFNDSLNLLVKNSKVLVAPASYALLDWILMFLCLKCSFYAARYPISNSALLVGFSVGIFATLFSFTPASIGVMEGSMAGSFYLMGLDYDHALVATLIYRTIYFVLPMLISLLFYKRFFPPSSKRAQLEAEGRAP